MNRTSLFTAAALLTALVPLRGQDKPTLKPYGFIRSYAHYDSRATKSLAEDTFFFIPMDEYIVGGNDLNAVGSYNYQGITTRLGVDLANYQVGDTKIAGKIESDFYCLNSGGNTGTLRMRQAYVNLLWDGRGSNGTTDYSLKIGQGWHPMAADLVHGVNLETGAPFTPFNRSAQVNFESTFNKKVTLTAALIQQLQYRSAGPAGASNKYQRHAVPELYLGVSAKSGGLLSRVGVSVLSIRPQYGYNSVTGAKYTDWLTTVSPFFYIQYTDGLFQIKAKSILAQAGEHMQLNGGYAATAIKSDGISMEYTPIRSTVSFISAQYGKTWQVLGMVGYQKNLGTSDPILDINHIYFSGNGYSNIDSMIRVTPTLMYNLGKMQFALEYDLTTVCYGTSLDSYVIPGGLHWVTNHRLLVMTKLNF